jgi:hypothetical protein
MTTPSGRPSTVALAAALVLSPSSILVATALDGTGAADPAGYLAQVAADRSAYLVAGLLLLIGLAGLVPAAAGLSRLAHGRPRVGVLRSGAALLAVAGVLSGAGVGLGFAPAYVATDPRSAAVAPAFVESLWSAPWALVSGVGSGLGFGAGLLVTGLGLWRARLVPRWAALCCALGPLALVAPGDVPWDAGPWLLVVLAFAAAAVALMSRADTDDTNRGAVVDCA